MKARSHENLVDAASQLEPTVTGAESLLSAEPPIATAAEVMRWARAGLVEIEVALRSLWYDTIDSAPAVAARLNSTVRLLHSAVNALSDDTVF